jgi:hypothetical protein
MIIDWQCMYHNGDFYSAGLHSTNGIVGYTAVVAPVAQIILSDEGLVLRITNSFYIVL